MAALLEVDGLTKAFGGLVAVNDMSLSVSPGEVLGLIGPNGSGKTTLLNLICGYYRPDQGSITIDSRPITGRHPNTIARDGVGRTFQTPQIPSGLTVRQVVETGTHVSGWVTIVETMLRLPRYWIRRRQDAATAAQILDYLRLTSYAGQAAVDLPLGTRRLVELARSLASRPRVLLLDEVASGLDEDEVGALARVVRSLAASGLTIVLVEHNFALVRAVADVSFVLADGALIASGRPTEVEADPTVRTVYFGAAPLAFAGGLQANRPDRPDAQESPAEKEGS
jgi:branched-chain amino acid transport system permease protein